MLINVYRVIDPLVKKKTGFYIKSQQVANLTSCSRNFICFFFTADKVALTLTTIYFEEASVSLKTKLKP